MPEVQSLVSHLFHKCSNVAKKIDAWIKKEMALAVVKSTANPSRSPNLVAHDANFDGFQLVREYAQLQDLVIVEIFDHTKWSE